MALNKNNQQNKNQGSKKDQEPTRYGQSSNKDIDSDQDDVGQVGQGRANDDEDLDTDDDDSQRK